MFNEDSFVVLPLNWKEITSYLNHLVELHAELHADVVDNTVFEDALWEDYWNSKLPNAPLPKWRYAVELQYFVTGQGYSYSEDFDEGETDHFFTAKEWNNGLDEPIETDTEDGWVSIIVRFYDANDEDVISSVINKTLCGKF